VSQFTIDVDVEMEKAIRNAAKRDALSVSQWIKEKLQSEAVLSSWPSGYMDLLGSIDDPTFTAPEELNRELDQQVLFS